MADSSALNFCAQLTYFSQNNHPSNGHPKLGLYLVHFNILHLSFRAFQTIDRVKLNLISNDHFCQRPRSRVQVQKSEVVHPKVQKYQSEL